MTAIYLVGVTFGPLYFSAQACRPSSRPTMGFFAAWLDWVNCHLKPQHVDLGSYGSWLSGTVLIAAVYWGYQTYLEQAKGAWEQRRAVFLSTQEQYHARFEALAELILKDLYSVFKFGCKGTMSVAMTASYIRQLLNIEDRERVAAELEKSVNAAEYVRLACGFVDMLKAFDFPQYQCGDWSLLLKIIERTRKDHLHANCGRDETLDLP